LPAEPLRPTFGRGRFADFVDFMTRSCMSLSIRSASLLVQRAIASKML
jgi:hypothetical protein